MMISPPRPVRVYRDEERQIVSGTMEEAGMIGPGLHGCFGLFKRGFFRVDEYGGLCYPGGGVRGRSRQGMG